MVSHMAAPIVGKSADSAGELMNMKIYKEILSWRTGSVEVKVRNGDLCEVCQG